RTQRTLDQRFDLIDVQHEQIIRTSAVNCERKIRSDREKKERPPVLRSVGLMGCLDSACEFDWCVDDDEEEEEESSTERDGDIGACWYRFKMASAMAPDSNALRVSWWRSLPLDVFLTVRGFTNTKSPMGTLKCLSTPMRTRDAI